MQRKLGRLGETQLRDPTELVQHSDARICCVRVSLGRVREDAVRYCHAVLDQTGLLQITCEKVRPRTVEYVSHFACLVRIDLVHAGQVLHKTLVYPRKPPATDVEEIVRDYVFLGALVEQISAIVWNHPIRVAQRENIEIHN